MKKLANKIQAALCSSWRDWPGRIVLSTNFGLILSDDGGQTWSWTCEQQNTLFANRYQLGSPSLDRLYVLSSRGLVCSDDESCTWNVSGGELALVTAVDAFADP
jgi:hypothetical protein